MARIIGLAVPAVLAAWLVAAAFSGTTGRLPAAGAQQNCGPTDVVFVIDTTGSMGSAIDNVKAETGPIIQLINSSSGGDFRLGLVTFKDDVTVEVDISANTASIQAAIAALSASGGSGTPEASDEALNTVVNGLDAADRPPTKQSGNFGSFRTSALKIAVLITDAPPGGFDDTFTAGVDDVNAHTVALAAKAKGIRISAVFVPTDGPSATIEAIMMDYADTSGGFYTMTQSDGTGTADAIKDIIENCSGASGQRPRANVGGAIGAIAPAAAQQARDNRATAVPAAQAPVATVTAPRTGTGVTPPNTGDAGLAGSSSSWTPFAIGGITAFALAGLATLKFARR